MGKFLCVCGSVISESPTDFMRARAHLIPDQDWEEIAEGTEEQRREILRKSRSIWQCVGCGTLHVSDGQMIRSFTPADPAATPHDLLRSVYGDDWPGLIVANWWPWITGRPNGELWWSDGDPTRGGAEHFDDPDALTRRYNEVFQERHAQGKVRSSFLRIDGTIVHRWPA